MKKSSSKKAKANWKWIVGIILAIGIIGNMGNENSVTNNEETTMMIEANATEAKLLDTETAAIIEQNQSAAEIINDLTMESTELVTQVMEAEKNTLTGGELQVKDVVITEVTSVTEEAATLSDLEVQTREVETQETNVQETMASETKEPETEIQITEAQITEAPEPISEGTSYVINTNTGKFHYPGCSSVKDIKSKNRWDYVGTREEVINMGYVPCKKCDP